MAEEARVYSLADQTARFERAKAENNERYLNIASVFDGSYLKDKRVLLIGANKGLGLCISQELAKQGAHLIGTCRVTSPELDACAKQVITNVEVTSQESFKAMASQITEPLDYMIFNAGYFPDIVDTLESPNEAEALKQIDICALGPLRCVSACRSAGILKGAKVAIITSQAGSAQWRTTQNQDRGGDYGHHMCRAACNMGCALMSEEMKPEGIPIIMLHPGFNRTGMTAKYSHIWDKEGAVDATEGAMRVLYEIGNISMESTGKFINSEDGLQIPF